MGEMGGVWGEFKVLYKLGLGDLWAKAGIICDNAGERQGNG